MQTSKASAKLICELNNLPKNNQVLVVQSESCFYK
jgi:hypothetical protein